MKRNFPYSIYMISNLCDFHVLHVDIYTFCTWISCTLGVGGTFFHVKCKGLQGTDNHLFFMEITSDKLREGTGHSEVPWLIKTGKRIFKEEDYKKS